MKHVWPMTFDTYARYEEIHRALQAAQADHDHIRYQEQLDALRSLPGFPPNTSDLDVLVPKIVTETYLKKHVLH